MTDTQNKLPIWLKYSLLLVPVIIAFFRLRVLDNDFYFLYPTGEYIIKSGFPHTDMLSMHSDMKIVVQQWLSSVVFYFAYSKLGKLGVFSLLYIFYWGICALTYRLISEITKNELVSVVLSVLCNLLIFDAFIVTRPHIFSLVILLGAVCLLEKYVQTGKRPFLFPIPVLSLALINFHASMWAMLFILMLPYIVSAMPFHIKAVEHEPCCSLLDLLFVAAVSIVMGFLNPYGIENMLYLTTSFGNETINKYIVEMKPMSLDTVFGKTFLIILAIAGTYLLLSKRKAFSLRFYLMFIGTLLLSLMHIKGSSYFLLFGLPSFSFMLKDFELKKTGKEKLSKRTTALLVAFASLFLAFVCYRFFFASRKSCQFSDNYYKQLDSAVEIMEKSSEPVILYANFNDGQYFEFKGYHPYIDGRAELFLAANNNEFDYFDEYYDLFRAKLYYRDFVDKYQFNYLVVNKEYNRYLYISLLNDPDFELVYETEQTNLFVRKSV